jgi:hypothetical protein
MDFIIEKNDFSNIDELIELAHSYYKDRDVNKKEYLEWQYLQNPAGKAFLYTSRENNTGEIAGQYIVIPVIFNRSGEKISGSIALNLLTKPKFRRNGLFPLMVSATHKECKEKDVLFTIGMPNHQSYPGLTQKLGFSHLGDIPLLIKPFNIFRLIKSYFNRSKEEKHGGVIKLDVIPNHNIKLLDFERKSDEIKINEFWDLVKFDYPLSTYKDYIYLKWRYYDLPTREYYVLYYENNNKIEGLIILKAEKIWGFNVGMIMDLIIKDNDKKIARELLDYSKRICKRKKLDFLTVLHTSNHEFSLLIRNGFWVVPYKLLPQKTHYIVRINNEFEGSDFLMELNNWKLTFGDYDVF